MGIITSLVKMLLKLIIYIAVFSSIVLLIPNLPPYTQFTKLQPEPSLPRTGALAPNELLNNPGKLFEGKILGPEAFEVHNGEVYTGLATGEIVKLSPAGHVTFVTKFGKPCSGLQQEHICGRPLGIQIDKKTNQLYAADAYHGIWKVDLKTGKQQLLVSPDVEINGKKPKLINDIALDSNGDLFWTDSSSDFALKDGSHTVLMDPSGRLFHYNAAKNVSTVVADKLGFANGVVISPDRQFVLVAETASYKVTKIYIRGPKKGKSEVFIAGLPGTPDNMRALPDGSGVLVALYTVFDDHHPLITRSLQPLPLVRKFLVRTLLMVENAFDFLNTQVPHPILEDIVYHVGSFKSVAGLLSGESGLVQLDWSGNIVAAYFSADGRTPTMSDALVVGDRLWTAAPHIQDYVATFPAPPQLVKAFAAPKEEKPQIKKVEPPKATPAPPTQPPSKPTAKPVEKKPAQQTTPPPVQKPPPTKPVEKQEKKPAQQTTPPPKKPVQQSTPPPAPKAAEKPKPAEKQPEKKPATPQPKQNAKAAEPVKPKETKPTETVKQAEKPKVQVKEQQKPTTAKTETKQPPKADKQIPVREEIPSDTAKPSSEKLKVIKKSGPDVIPNHWGCDSVHAHSTREFRNKFLTFTFKRFRGTFYIIIPFDNNHSIFRYF